MTHAPLLPVCVDLDGTLIRTDLLFESLLLLTKRNPLYLLLVPIWLCRGKAHLKLQIARRVSLNAAMLPYDAGLLSWLRAQRSAGHSLWLCTASNQLLADVVAAHLGIFDGVMASSATSNLSGEVKAAALVDRFGARGFDYCGDHRLDLPVWKCARRAIVVRGSSALEARAKQVSSSVQEFGQASGIIGPLLRSLRPHQWAKNALILVPLLAAHKAADLHALGAGMLGVLVFSLCASSVYLLNDMLDLEADRQHPRKCKRPFASGELPLAVGFVLIPILLTAAVLWALLLPATFELVLGLYFVVTLGYSFKLKSWVLVDALCLATLYTARIVAGAVATQIPLSFWLLLFSVFLFLSLALVKRYAELETMRRAGKLRAAGRGYHVEDVRVLQSLGTSAGYLSVLVLALYINSPAVESLYRHPEVIWLLCVLMLYWISRVWMIAHRGDMHDDPVIFAMRDGVSVGLAALAAIVLVIGI